MTSSSVLETTQVYDRDLIGYGDSPIHPQWPNQSSIAISFVLNFETGGENCLLHGDTQSEHLLSEIVGAQPRIGVRHMNMESCYEYGPRAGFWRLHRAFTRRNLPLTGRIIIYYCTRTYRIIML